MVDPRLVLVRHVGRRVLVSFLTVLLQGVRLPSLVFTLTKLGDAY